MHHPPVAVPSSAAPPTRPPKRPGPQLAARRKRAENSPQTCKEVQKCESPAVFFGASPPKSGLSRRGSCLWIPLPNELRDHLPPWCMASQLRQMP